jgi:hypothetical protein
MSVLTRVLGADDRINLNVPKRYVYDVRFWVGFKWTLTEYEKDNVPSLETGMFLSR